MVGLISVNENKHTVDIAKNINLKTSTIRLIKSILLIYTAVEW